MTFDYETEEWLKRPTLLPPTLRQIEGTKFWQFMEEYRVSLPPPHFPLRLIIPIGWAYDRSSIPMFVPNWFISRDSLGTLAPAPHDAGYGCKGLFPSYPDNKEPYIVKANGCAIGIDFSREEVDRWFLLYMLRQRITHWRAVAAYNAVRTFWRGKELLGLSREW